MKLTQRQIKRIIKEELSKILAEQEDVKDIDGDNWWDGKDVDFLSAESGPVILFDKDQEYKKEKYTHGLYSHFLKHVRDIGMEQEISGLIAKFKTLLLKGLEQNVEIYYFDGQSSVPLTDEIINKFSPKQFAKVARITLDRINDDVVGGGQVSSLEKQLHSSLLSSVKKYDKIAQDIIKSPVAKAVSDADPKKVAFTKDGKLVITYDKKIASAFGNKKCASNPEGCVEKAVAPRK